jgi:hypothetical protein
MIRYLVYVLLFLSFGCQRAQPTDPLNEGFHKIDQEDYDGAISYLEDLNEGSSDSRIKMALASAYAGRAGLKIENFWNFAKAMRGPAIDEQALQQQPVYIHNKSNVDIVSAFVPEQTRTDLNQLFLTMAAFSIYRERLALYPYVKPAQRTDLQRASDVLAGTTNPGARLYRATINSVILRSELDDGFDVWGSIENKLSDAIRYPLSIPQAMCTPLTGDLTQWLNQQFELTKVISQDMGIAFSSQASQFKTFSAPVSSYQKDLPRLQANLIPETCRAH